MHKHWYNAEEALDIIFSHLTAPEDSEISDLEDNDEVAEEQKILEAERLPNVNEPDVPVLASTSSSESEFDDDDSEQLPINNAVRNTMEDTRAFFHTHRVPHSSYNTISFINSNIFK